MEINLTLSQRHESMLLPFVDAYNLTNGTKLTMPEWILLHLKEVAVGPRVTQEFEQIQREEETTKHDRQATARQAAIDEL